MNLIPNTLLNEDDVMDFRTANEKGELFKIVIDFVNQHARIEKILENTRVVDCLDFEIFKMNRNLIREDEMVLEFIKSQRDQLYEECLKKARMRNDKLLEQEPILDKIIADIGSALSEEVLDDNKQKISDIGIGLEIALSIIDKYKAESEED